MVGGWVGGGVTRGADAEKCSGGLFSSPREEEILDEITRSDASRQGGAAGCPGGYQGELPGGFSAPLLWVGPASGSGRRRRTGKDQPEPAGERSRRRAPAWLAGKGSLRRLAKAEAEERRWQQRAVSEGPPRSIFMQESLSVNWKSGELTANLSPVMKGRGEAIIWHLFRAGSAARTLPGWL